MAEAFVKTFERDYVSMGDLSTADAVRSQLPNWFQDYNEIKIGDFCEPSTDPSVFFFK